jgi:hypothetical protein
MIATRPITNNNLSTNLPPPIDSLKPWQRVFRESGISQLSSEDKHTCGMNVARKQAPTLNRKKIRWQSDSESELELNRKVESSEATSTDGTSESDSPDSDDLSTDEGDSSETASEDSSSEDEGSIGSEAENDESDDESSDQDDLEDKDSGLTLNKSNGLEPPEDYPELIPRKHRAETQPHSERKELARQITDREQTLRRMIASEHQDSLERFKSKYQPITVENILSEFNDKKAAKEMPVISRLERNMPTFLRDGYQTITPLYQLLEQTR